jgi:putative addiction module component (TIGR02574 family)
MAANASDVLQQAMDLPTEDRLAVATELLNSVEGPEDPGWADVWREELKRRLREYESGAVQGIPWSEAKERALAALREK